MSLGRVVPLVLILTVFVFPPVALACPMCKEAAASDLGTAAAYNWSVVLLAFLPFVLVAALASQAVRASNPTLYMALLARLRAFFWRRGWLYLTVAALSLAFAAYAATPRVAAANFAAAQSAVIRAPALNATAAIQPADLDDKVVIFTFFASWCGPCREQVSELSEIRQDLGGDELVVVAVNAFEGYRLPHTHPDGVVHYHRPSDIAGDLPAFVSAIGPEVYVVPSTPEIAAAFGDVTRIPTTFVFDRDGRLVRRYVNEPSGDFLKPTRDVMRQDIEQAMACGHHLPWWRAACISLWN